MFARLIVYSLAAFFLYFGYQWYSDRLESMQHPQAGPAETSVASSHAPTLPVALSDPAFQSATHPPGGAPLMIPVKLAGTMHAAALNEILQLIGQGKDTEAEAKLHALPPDALNDPAVRISAATLWNNLGAARAQASGTAAGVSAYKAAVAINPYNPVAHHNLITAYWELRDPALTPELLEEAIRLNPDNPLPHLALAELLMNKDELATARTHLEHGKERVAAVPNLQSYLGMLIGRIDQTQKAEQKFVARDSSHFQVKFDGDADHALWNRVVEILEDAYREIGQKFDHYPAKPMLVVLHARETFQGATGSPAWADGLFDPTMGRIKVPTQGALTDQTWLTRVLRHEYVHALLHDRVGGRLGAVPTWLNEGLAMQLAGDPWPDLDKVIRGQVILINLSRLEGPWMGLPPQAATVAYLEGSSATAYMIERYGMEKVREIIGQLANGQPIHAAIQDSLFIPYDDFQRRWIDELNEKIKAGRSS